MRRRHISIAVTIYLKDMRSNGKIPVKFRLTYGKSHYSVSSGYFVTEADLVPVRGNQKESTNRQIRNRQIYDLVYRKVRELEDVAVDYIDISSTPSSAKEVYDDLVRAVEKKFFYLDFPKFCRGFISKKESRSHQAALNYSAALKQFCGYIHRDSFDISEVTSAKMAGFEEYLVERFGRDARAVSLYTSHIEAMHKSAQIEYNSEEYGDIKIKNPFLYYHSPKQPHSRHRAISPKIIQGMINDYQSLVGVERLAVGAYLISFALMGINAPDLFECLLIDDDIISYDSYDRAKTKARRYDNAHMEIQLPSYATNLFSEYLDDSPKKRDKTAFVFHCRYSSLYTFRDALRIGLKKYKKRIEIEEALTFYTARHSWATIARSKDCKIPLSIIDDCLDHVGSYKIGDIYAKKDFSVLWDANDTVLSTLDWTPLDKKGEG